MIKEFSIISDNDGHYYVCPVECIEEALKAFEEISKYWNEGNYEKECPKEPSRCYRVGGGLSLVKFERFRIEK